MYIKKKNLTLKKPIKNMNTEEILEKALELEKEAIEEYSRMKEFATVETEDILNFLIGEEKKHVKLIKNRLDAVKLLK